MSQLKENYNVICNRYLKRFCENYDFHYEGYDAWVANDVGGVACCGDYFFDFSVIKYSVDNDLHDISKLLEWYDYTMFAHEFNLTNPNWSSWNMNCPRLDKSQQARIINLKKELERTINEYQEKF